MAKRKSDRRAPRAAEDEPEATDDLPAQDEQDELGLAGKGAMVRAGAEPDADGDAPDASDDEVDPVQAQLDAAASGDTELAEGGQSAAQLGTERYVMAAFFAGGMTAAYIFGRFVHGIWSYAANKDWLNQTLPRLAAVPDEEKTTYGFILGAIAAFILVLRTYRKPDVRAWCDEVASELSKVKWPSKKEVTSSTMVVIAASAIATIYLALLDRLWGFITNLVYGDGS